MHQRAAQAIPCRTTRATAPKIVSPRRDQQDTDDSPVVLQESAVVRACGRQCRDPIAQPVEQRSGHLVEHGAGRRRRAQTWCDGPVPLPESAASPCHVRSLQARPPGVAHDPLERVMRQQGPLMPAIDRRRRTSEMTATSSTRGVQGSTPRLLAGIHRVQQRAACRLRPRACRQRPAIEQSGLDHLHCRGRLGPPDRFVTLRGLLPGTATHGRHGIFAGREQPRQARVQQAAGLGARVPQAFGECGERRRIPIACGCCVLLQAHRHTLLVHRPPVVFRKRQPEDRDQPGRERRAPAPAGETPRVHPARAAAATARQLPASPPDARLRPWTPNANPAFPPPGSSAQPAAARAGRLPSPTRTLRFRSGNRGDRRQHRRRRGPRCARQQRRRAPAARRCRRRRARSRGRAVSGPGDRPGRPAARSSPAATAAR